MTDETRGMAATAAAGTGAATKGRSSGLFSSWKRDRKPRRPNVWHGESFDIGSSFRPLRTMSCTNININTTSSGSGSNVRCLKRYGGLIDVDDEYLTVSEEEGNGDGQPDTIYGSPKSMSTDGDEADVRPGFRSRGTGTTTQSFQTARTHQPVSSGSLLPPAFTTQSRTTSTTTTRTDDFHSAYSSIPPASSIPSSPELSTSRWPTRGGSSSTADLNGSTRRLIPPATGVTYDTSRQSDHSGNHVGIPPIQPELADWPEGDGAALLARRSSAPLPGSKSGSKLKSALKFRSRAINEDVQGNHERGFVPVAEGGGGPTRSLAKKTKTVQFPVGHELDDAGGAESVSGLRTRWRGLRGRLRDGDDGDSEDDDAKSDHSLEPADPKEVLARTGSEVVGTSAGVIEAHRARPGVAGPSTSAQVDPTVNLSSSRDPRTHGRGKNKGKGKPMGNDELGLDPTVQTEAAAHPDAVVLRDRMLVRVGRNRERGLAGYDEAMSRRKPCSRLERMEGEFQVHRHGSLLLALIMSLSRCAAEYLVVYRKGRIELYQEWVGRPQ